MKKRISTFALAALMITSALVSCADAAEDKTSADTTAAVTEGTAAPQPTIYDDLPEADYGGYEFRILNNTSNFAYTNMGLDGQTGEALDDVIFERNAKVEELLNVSLVITDMGWEDNQKAINTTVPAGEDAYDVYFNEQIEHIAKFKPDIIIVPGYQRGERTDIIRAQAKLMAFRCNAFVARSSYSMNDDLHGGCSMIVSPDGNIIPDIGKGTGSVSADVEPTSKYMRTAGFGGSVVRNDDFINDGLCPEAF